MTDPTRSRIPVSLLLYLGFAFVAFLPCLVSGQAYFASDLLYLFTPFRMFLKAQLSQGHFPLWNPYIMGGQPFFADPQAMMAYPLTYLTLLFPVPYDLGVTFFIHMALAAAGMHFWLKGLRLSPNACRMGALLYASSGLFWWELVHLQVLAVYALFPWLMGSLERTFKEGNPRWAFMSGLFFALILCGGGLQPALPVFYAGFFYALYRLLGGGPAEPGTPAPYRWPMDRWMPILLLLIWGALPLLVPLIPNQEFSDLSNRPGPTTTYEKFNGIFSMKPFSTYELLFPTLGVPQGDTIENALQRVTDKQNVDNDFLGEFGYLGIWIPFLIFFAFKRKDRGFLYFIGAMGLLALLAAWGRYFPLHRLICLILPGMGANRSPYHFLQFYVAAACVLAAYGFQTLEQALKEKDRRWVFGAGFYSLVLLMVGLSRVDQSWREILGLLLGMAGLVLWALTEQWQPLGYRMFQGGLILPLLLTGWNGYSLGPASNFDYAGNFPAFSELQKRTGGRFYLDPSLAYPVTTAKGTDRVSVPENAMVPLGIRDIGGYSSVYLKTETEVKQLPFTTFSKLMAMRGLLLPPGKGEAIGFKRTDLGGYELYEPAAPPPALIATTQALPVDNGGKEILAMALNDYDPYFQIYLRHPLPDNLKAKLTNQKVGVDYQLTKDQVDDQQYQVNLSANALVAFSEIDYPGWKAFVDGQPSEIFPANHCFRSVFILSGNHQVEFRYQPNWAMPLLLLLAVWSVSFLLYLAYLFVPRGKPNLETPTPN